MDVDVQGQEEGQEQFLTQRELAERWKKRPRTLERWRWLGVGPEYIKAEGGVRYPLSRVQAYERERLKRPVRREPRQA
jgi:hypothetical protein